ncbi:hypothetical protein LT330_005915 [Penicillium expansum]|nr:hypothetical protein LT330_005915 [Penicillium expansum]
MKAISEAQNLGERLADKEGLDTPKAVESVDRPLQYWTEEENNPSNNIEKTPSFGKSRVGYSKWLPDYASPLPPSITSEDCEFLHEQGAFNVPDTRGRAGILNAYFQFIHPALPILSPEDFLMVLDTTYNGNRGISLLLFQAVIFAATAWQPNDSLVLQGFKDRREARQARFERAKLLYSYGCEEDRITILQSLLLMTFWDDTSDQGQEAWHFVGLAKGIMNSIKTNPTDSEKKFIKQQPGLWSRICWSCYIRDRLVCLQTRRPFQFDEADYRVQALRPSDFEVGPLPTKCCLGNDGSHPAIRDPSMRNVFSQISISLLQCCKCITRILTCQYTLSQDPNQFTDTPRSTLLPRRSHEMSVEVLLCDIELEEWLTTLPEALRWCSSNPGFQISKHGELFLHFRAMLSGIYSLACSALHRPQLVVRGTRLPELFELSKRRLRHSGNTVTQIYEYLRSQNLTYLFPEFQVTVLETALVTHLDHLKSTHSPTRQLAMESFQLCVQGLRQLRETYSSAVSALGSVDAAIRNPVISLETADTHLTHSLDSDEVHHERTIPPQCEYYDRPESFASSPTIAQQLDNLNPPQMSKLLCSHFMMTPSERSLLQDLASTEASNFDLYSDADSSSDEDSYPSSAQDPISYQSHLPSTKVASQTEASVPNPQLHPSMRLCQHGNFTDDWNIPPSLLFQSDIVSKPHYIPSDEHEDMALSMFDTA